MSYMWSLVMEACCFWIIMLMGPSSPLWQLLNSLTECLSVDTQSLGVWRQLYTKHLSQSRSVSTSWPHLIPHRYSFASLLTTNPLVLFLAYFWTTCWRSGTHCHKRCQDYVLNIISVFGNAKNLFVWTWTCWFVSSYGKVFKKPSSPSEWPMNSWVTVTVSRSATLCVM